MRLADQASSVDPPQLPDWIVQQACSVGLGRCALYVVSLDGDQLIRLSGDVDLADRIAIGQVTGPEIAEAPMREIAATIFEDHALRAVPVWVYGRATFVLLTDADADGAARIEDLLSSLAAPLEIAARFTDVVERARRVQPLTAAAELQHNLLPARIARLTHAELAAAVVPAHEGGGDFFDHAHNPECCYFALGDAVGHDAHAAAIAALAVGALRSSRRARASLPDRAEIMQDAIAQIGDDAAFVTAILGEWHGQDRAARILNLGHPDPLLVRADGTIEIVRSPPVGAIGLLPNRPVATTARTLQVGDRLVLLSDGVLERRVAQNRFFGLDGVRDALAAAESLSATSAAASLIDAVRHASGGPLGDDATVMVIACTD